MGGRRELRITTNVFYCTKDKWISYCAELPSMQQFQSLSGSQTTDGELSLRGVCIISQRYSKTVCSKARYSKVHWVLVLVPT